MRNSYFVNVTEEVINAIEDAASQNWSSSVNSKTNQLQNLKATEPPAFGELLIIIHKLKLVDEKLNDSC